MASINGSLEYGSSLHSQSLGQTELSFMAVGRECILKRYNGANMSDELMNMHNQVHQLDENFRQVTTTVDRLST